MPSNTFLFQVAPGTAVKPGHLERFVVTVPGGEQMAKQFAATVPGVDTEAAYVPYHLGSLQVDFGPACVCAQASRAASMKRQDSHDEFESGEQF